MGKGIKQRVQEDDWGSTGWGSGVWATRFGSGQVLDSTGNLQFGDLESRLPGLDQGK